MMNAPPNNALQPIPQPTIITKQQMSRKRTFAEIVDLTEDISSGEERMRKQLQNSLAVKTSSDLASRPLFSNEPLLPGDMPSREESRNKMFGNAPAQSSTRSPSPNSNRPLNTRTKFTAAQEELRKSKDIVQPIDRANALRRSTYDSRTIARDILLACGKHPTMAPLNAHLEPLRRNFAHVDSLSDLGTFKWDLADPGGPEAAAPEADGHDADDEDIDPPHVQLLPQPRRRGRRPRVMSIVGGETVTVDTCSIVLAMNAEYMLMKADVEITPLHKTLPSRGRPRIRGNPGIRSRAGNGGVTNSPRQMASPDAFGANNFPPAGQPSTPSVQIQQYTAPSESASGLPHGTTMTSGFTPSPILPTREGRPPTEPSSEKRRRGRPPGAKDKTPRNRQVSLPSHPRPSNETTPARASNLRNVTLPSDGVAVVIETQAPKHVVDGGPLRRPRCPKPEFNPNPSKPDYKIYECNWKQCRY